MKNPEIYNTWTEFINNPTYSDYFKTDTDKWYSKFDELKDYLDNHKKRPSSKNKNTEQLGSWVGKAIKNYQNKKRIMKNEEIYNCWTEFMNNPNYNIYFKSKNEIWYDHLAELKQFIDNNKRRPCSHSKDSDEKKIASWLVGQSDNYKNKQNCMKNKDIYDTWTNFINDPNYIDYILDKQDRWHHVFKNVKDFILKNNKSPSSIGDTSNERLLGQWLTTQRGTYKNKSERMKEKEYYHLWTEFTNDPLYLQNPISTKKKDIDKTLMTNEEFWYNKFHKLKEFIKENNKLPNRDIDRITKNGKRTKIELSDPNDINEKNLGIWISHQRQNYLTKKLTMSNIDIYNTWTEFINNPTYSKYFKSNTELWNDNFTKVIEFTDVNGKLPAQTSKNMDEKYLGVWCSSQRQYYPKKNLLYV